MQIDSGYEDSIKFLSDVSHLAPKQTQTVYFTKANVEINGNSNLGGFFSLRRLIVSFLIA